LRESHIWRVIMWTAIVVGAVMLIIVIDPGFLYVLSAGAIPVDTGGRIELLVTPGTPISGRAATDLYWLDKDGTFAKVASLNEFPKCVTALDGQLFVTFAVASGGVTRSGASSIFRDGKWVRSVSAPERFDIDDVVSLGGLLYAFGVSPDGGKIDVRVLEENGWRKPAEPFDAGTGIAFAGCLDVSGVIEVLYASGPRTSLGGPDLEKTQWRYVSFDGSRWGEPQALHVPPAVSPNVAAYGDKFALVLSPVKEGEPLNVAVVDGPDLKTVADIPTKGLGAVQQAWLVPLGGQEHVLVITLGRIWDVPLANGAPGIPRMLLETSQSSRLRSEIYVGILAVGAVLLVFFGLAWLFIRLRAVLKGRKR